MPYIPFLKVENARQGFLSRADFEALVAQLTDADVRDFVEWFWWTGMRPGEIRQLTWAMLDRETWTLHLDPKAAKIGKGRTIPLGARYVRSSTAVSARAASTALSSSTA